MCYRLKKKFVVINDFVNMHLELDFNSEDIIAK